MNRRCKSSNSAVHQPVVAYHRDTYDIGLKIGDTVATFGGEFDELDNGESVIQFATLHTDPEHRRARHATRLVSALAHLALRERTTKLRGSVESQHTITIFSKVFGDDALHFYDRDPHTNTYPELPMSTDQAIQSLELAEEHEDDLEDRDIGFTVIVDLAGRRAHEFEKPDMSQLD